MVYQRFLFNPPTNHGFISYFHYVITPCTTRITNTTSAASPPSPYGARTSCGHIF